MDATELKKEAIVRTIQASARDTHLVAGASGLSILAGALLIHREQSRASALKDRTDVPDDQKKAHAGVVTVGALAIAGGLYGLYVYSHMRKAF